MICDLPHQDLSSQHEVDAEAPPLDFLDDLETQPSQMSQVFSMLCETCNERQLFF